MKTPRQMKFAGLFLLMSPQQASTMMQAKDTPILANIGHIFARTYLGKEIVILVAKATLEIAAHGH